jgi:hypothetical protein
MSGFHRIGRMPSSTLRLDYRFRWGLYAAFSVLFVTGAGWIITNSLRDSPGGELWQAISADLLMVHGGVTMVTLVLLGALTTVHIQRAWRVQRNRLTGTVMAASNVVLIATAFGLYYAGSDTFRVWISYVHIVFGLSLPALLFIHVLTGRRHRDRDNAS